MPVPASPMRRRSIEVHARNWPTGSFHTAEICSRLPKALSPAHRRMVAATAQSRFSPHEYAQNSCSRVDAECNLWLFRVLIAGDFDCEAIFSRLGGLPDVLHPAEKLKKDQAVAQISVTGKYVLPVLAFHSVWIRD